MPRKKKQKIILKPMNFLMLTLAGIVNAIGVTLFLYPVQIFDSGISGLSMFLDQVTPEFLPLSLFLVILNTPIFIFGAKKQGWAFIIYSLYAIAIYSLVSFVILNVFEIGDVGISVVQDDLFLSAIFGGLISGVGSGLTIRYGGAIDGIEVLGVTFAKKLGLSIGNFVLIFCICLYIVVGIVMSDWVIPLYSVVTYFVGSKTVDFVVNGFNHSTSATIITEHADKVTKVLSQNFGASGTVIKATGGYSKKEKEVIIFILNQFQVNRFQNVVLSVDPEAHISFQEVSDVIIPTTKTN